MSAWWVLAALSALLDTSRGHPTALSFAAPPVHLPPSTTVTSPRVGVPVTLVSVLKTPSDFSLCILDLSSDNYLYDLFLNVFLFFYALRHEYPSLRIINNLLFNYL